MQLQLEGPDLDELLARVRRECGPEARIVQADRVRTGGIAGFFSRERFEVLVEVEDVTDPTELTDPTGLPDPNELPDTSELTEMADRVSRAERFAALRRDSDSDSDEAQTASPEEPAAAPAAAPGAAAPRAATPPAAAPPATVRPAVSTESASFREVLTKLTRLSGVEDRSGLPAPGGPVPDGQALTSMVTAVMRLPEPPAARLGDGDVLALVGETTAAMRLARDVAAETRLPADAITLVSRGGTTERLPARLRASGPESAAQRRAQWSRRTHPTIVVVDAPLSLRGVQWAAETLIALQPCTTWAVVEASRKPEDVRAWVERLGRVDALAVDDIDSTADPASVLGVGVPVARLDGRPATRSAWAGVLAARLADQGAR